MQRKMHWRKYCDLKKAVMEFKAWRSMQDIKIIIL